MPKQTKAPSAGGARSSDALITALAALVLLLFAAAPAAAHPSLVQSGPEGGVVAERAPREVVLSFTEDVVVDGSSITLTAPDGRRIAMKPVTGDGSTLSARVAGELRPAVYDVAWVARGGDGHTLAGSFRFGIPRAGGAPPPGVESLGTPGVRAAERSSGDGLAGATARWLGVAAAGVLLAGALLRRRLREARDPRWERLVRRALLVLAAASLSSALTFAFAGEAGSASLLVDEAGGALPLLRVVLALAALGYLAGAARRVDAAAALVGAVALSTFGLAGHVETATAAPALAYAGIVVHVLAAGVWTGGLVLLALGVPSGVRSVRAFTPLAAFSVVALTATGVLAALREVDAWYFLRWSDYGRVVLAKGALLLLAAPAALLTVAALRRGRTLRLALRFEAAAALAIVLLAGLLAGLTPGRGQPLPAQTGALLTGAAFPTASTGDAAIALAVAPARAGANVVTASAEALGEEDGAAPRLGTVDVALLCTTCSQGGPAARTVRLRRGAGGTWSAPVDLPGDGAWTATVKVDGKRAIAPVALAVGDDPARGTTPREALMTADLTGEAGARCRAHAMGAQLAVGRFDARGGLPGGHKLALRVEDDGGDPARAAKLARAARKRGAVALLSPCGDGAAGAVSGAPDLPAVLGDTAAAPGARPAVWRTAGRPEAEGVALGRYLLEKVRPARAGTAPERVAAVVGGAGRPAPAVAARIDSLERTLRAEGVELVRMPAATATDRARLRAAIHPRHWMATVLDGDGGPIADTLRAIGESEDAGTLVPTPILTSSPLLDERFQRRAGVLGRMGAIGSLSEVVTTSADAQRYVTQTRGLFPRDRPSVAGLRGYVAGLALAHGLAEGTDPATVTARLRRPERFTDALVTPWRADAPAAGSTHFHVLAGRFLTSNLLPRGLGGQEHAGSWFDGGGWVRTTTESFGPALS